MSFGFCEYSLQQILICCFDSQSLEHMAHVGEAMPMQWHSEVKM